MAVDYGRLSRAKTELQQGADAAALNVSIPVEKALDHVFGYGVGLDMTRRDIPVGLATETLRTYNLCLHR